MATQATVVLGRRLRHSPHMTRHVYTIPSVLPASSSTRYELPINVSVGVLRQVKFVMENNTMAEFFIGSEDISFQGTIAQVAAFHNVAQGCVNYNSLNAIFENSDTPPAGQDTVPSLYIEINNIGSSVATGSITLELILDEGGTR